MHFTEQSKWVATQYPPAKYDNTNMKVVKPKHFAAHIGKPEPKPTSTWVIPKEASPGPGSYNVPEAMEKGTWGKVKGQFKQTYHPPSFTQKHTKMLSHVPGVGAHKLLETAKDKVGKDTNFRYQRH